MGGTALAEIDKAQAAASKAMAKVENSTDGILDRARTTISDINRTTLDTRNRVLDTYDKACEVLKSNLLVLGPELKEPGVKAVNEVFSRIEQLPDRFDEQLSTSKERILKRAEQQIRQLIDSAREEIDRSKGLVEAKKDELIGALGEQVNGLSSGLGAMTEGLKAILNEMILEIRTVNNSTFADEAGSREGDAKPDGIFDRLNISARAAIDGISDDIGNGIKETCDELETSINEDFNEFLLLFEELPAKIDEAAGGIMDRVDSALDDSIAKASMLIREMISGCKEKLNEAIEAIGENIDGMIGRGVEVVGELRDAFTGALDDLVEQIRQFTDNTLNDIRNSVNRILRTVRKEVEKNIEAAREAVNETVIEMGRRLNREIEKIKNDLSREAEKQARELRVMGEEACAEAEENYVNAGYNEDTSVIPDIRAKGEDVLADIERTMSEQADRLILDFRSQADIFIPTIKQQGVELAVRAQGSGAAVMGECLRIGAGFAASITEKGREFTDDLENTVGGMSDAVKEKGDEYISGCGKAIKETAEHTVASGGELCGDHLERTGELANDIGKRFEELMKEAAAELKRYSTDYTGSVSTAVDDLVPGYLELFDAMKETSKDLYAETDEKMRLFAQEMKMSAEEMIRDISQEIEISTEEMDAAGTMTGTMESDMAAQIRERMDTLLNEFQVEYGKTMDIKDRCERITSKRVENLEGLKGKIEEKTKDMGSSMENLFVLAENDTGEYLDTVIKDLRTDTEQVLAGSSMEDAVEGLAKELEAKTGELNARMNEIDGIGEGARDRLNEAAAELDRSTEKAGEVGRKSVKDAMSGMSSMGAVIKDAGSGMTEKLNQAVAVVTAAGETGKAGMEAAKAAAQPGKGTQAGKTGDDRAAAGEQMGEDSTAAGEQMEDDSTAAGEQTGGGSGASEQTGDDRAGAGEQAGGNTLPGGDDETVIEGHDDSTEIREKADIPDSSAVIGGVPGSGGDRTSHLKIGDTDASGDDISSRESEKMSAPETYTGASGETDGGVIPRGVGMDEGPQDMDHGKVAGSAMEDHPTADHPSSDRPSSDRPSSDRPSSDHPNGGGTGEKEMPESAKKEEGIGIPEDPEGVDERDRTRVDDVSFTPKPISGNKARATGDTGEVNGDGIPPLNDKEDGEPGIEKARKKSIMSDLE